MVSSDSDEDRKERDQFAERLKRKDKDRTRNIAIPRSGMFVVIYFCFFLKTIIIS